MRLLSILMLVVALPVSVLAQDVRTNFVGTWELVQWYIDLGNGKRTYPFGEQAAGRITYTANKQMSVHLMRPGRPNLDTKSILEVVPDLTGDALFSGADDEVTKTLKALARVSKAMAVLKVLAAYQGYIAYYGTYAFPPDRKDTVTHLLEGCSFPNWIGSTQHRKFEFKGDQLILSAEVETSAGKLKNILLWKRVP